MKPKRYVVLFLILALSSVVTGCAAFREGSISRAGMLTETAMKKHPSIGVQVSGAVILNGKIYQSHPKTTKNWRAQTIRAYEESGLFSQVVESAGDTDLHAEVMIVDRGDPNRFFSFITGLTLYIIPSKATDKFTVKTAISDGDGNILEAFEKSETVTLWQHLFMIVAMPFNWPSSVAKEALYDLNRATISDAYAHGIL
ncbi:MAG: hypothetical protein SWH78_04920 [Thermodesulfobacteriota bacterium]|nr:hypothetical protein [Thermodesulfobacteriota bacterium]